VLVFQKTKRWGSHPDAFLHLNCSPTRFIHEETHGDERPEVELRIFDLNWESESAGTFR